MQIKFAPNSLSNPSTIIGDHYGEECPIVQIDGRISISDYYFTQKQAKSLGALFTHFAQHGEVVQINEHGEPYETIVGSVFSPGSFEQAQDRSQRDKQPFRLLMSHLFEIQFDYSDWIDEEDRLKSTMSLISILQEREIPHLYNCADGSNRCFFFTRKQAKRALKKLKKVHPERWIEWSIALVRLPILES